MQLDRWLLAWYQGPSVVDRRPAIAPIVDSSDKPIFSMHSNPPVNADACRRAAMYVGYRARAGYRER